MKFQKPRILTENNYPDIDLPQPVLFKKMINEVIFPPENSPLDKYIDTTVSFLTHYPPRNFLSPIFLKICTNIPQDVPIIRDRIVFWNKALLKSYKALYFFGFFNSVTLYFKIYFWIFYCWKPELSWIRIRWNFWDISIGSQDISKTVFIFLTVNLHKNDDFRLFVT